MKANLAHEFDYVDWDRFDRDIEEAKTRKEIADVIRVAGHMFWLESQGGKLEKHWVDDLDRLREATIPLALRIGITTTDAIAAKERAA